MGRPFKCPYCGSSDNVNKGVRKTKTMGLRKIRRCKNCRRKFTPRSQQPAADEIGCTGPASANAISTAENSDSGPETTDEGSADTVPPAP